MTMGDQNFTSFPQRRDQYPQDSSYSPRSAHSQQPSPSYYPARSQCSAPDMMLPVTTTAEQSYMIQSARLHHTLDYAPQSAVSSFNLEAHCDSSLLTPISIGGSPHLSIRSGPLNPGDRHMRPSPTSSTILSPFPQWGHDDDFRYSSPMKLKDPNATLQIHTNSDHEFPASYASPEPYYSGFGVSATAPASATSAPGRSMVSSPGVYHNSTQNSAGGYSNGNFSHHSTPPLSASSTESYRTHDIPTLGAPNPLALRSITMPGVKKECRQSSVQSNESCSSSASTERPKKRKSPSKSGSPDGIKKKKKGSGGSWIGMPFPEEFTDDERRILRMAAIRMEWKEAVRRFAAETGHTLTVACAQMRKKRLVDRIHEHNKRLNGAGHRSEERDSFEEDWDALREHDPLRMDIKVEGGSSEVGSPRTWHEPRSAYNGYPHNFAPIAPLLPSIQSTSTTMDRICSSGSDALQYYQSVLQQSEQKQRQLDQQNRQQNGYEERVREERQGQDESRRW